MNIPDIQTLLQKQKIDAWVMVDYENHHKVVTSLLGKAMLTRKIILIIPAKKREKAKLICHSIDAYYLSAPKYQKEFELLVYKTWQEMLDLEKKTIKAYPTVALDYSESGLLPRVSLIDYGSYSFIKAIRGVQIVSSMDLLQLLTAVLTEKGYELQKKACKKALEIKDEAFLFIKNRIEETGDLNEYQVQQFIAKRFKEEGMVYDDPPIVAIGPNANNPHYAPTEKIHSSIGKGDLVLIDMWAKYDVPEAGYADITWMGYVGESVPQPYKERFDIVKGARDAAIKFLQNTLPKRKVLGYEADDVAREFIAKAGYGEYFVHRLGHSIADDEGPHGPGANLDNYESHDERCLIDGTSFSDEPGIYAPDFGMRSETDLHIEGKNLVVIAGLQEEIIPILALKGGKKKK